MKEQMVVTRADLLELLQALDKERNRDYARMIFPLSSIRTPVEGEQPPSQHLDTVTFVWNGRDWETQDLLPRSFVQRCLK